MILNIFLPCFDDGCGKFQVEIATSIIQTWSGDSLPEISPCQNAATTARGSVTRHLGFISVSYAADDAPLKNLIVTHNNRTRLSLVILMGPIIASA